MLPTLSTPPPNPAPWAPLAPADRAAMFARISASRAPGTAISAFASGGGTHTMLSQQGLGPALLELLGLCRPWGGGIWALYKCFG